MTVWLLFMDAVQCGAAVVGTTIAFRYAESQPIPGYLMAGISLTILGVYFEIRRRM